MKAVPTWLVFVIGSLLLVSGCAYGVTYAFPAPDYTEEEARQVHRTWSLLKYPIYTGLLLIIFSFILAMIRGDPKRHEYENEK